MSMREDSAEGDAPEGISLKRTRAFLTRAMAEELVCELWNAEKRWENEGE